MAMIKDLMDSPGAPTVPASGFPPTMSAMAAHPVTPVHLPVMMGTPPTVPQLLPSGSPLHSRGTSSTLTAPVGSTAPTAHIPCGQPGYGSKGV